MALDTTPLTPVDAFTTSLYPPKTGTPVSATDVAAGEQVLLNRTENLNDHKAPIANPTFTGTVSLAAFGTLQLGASRTLDLSGGGAELEPAFVYLSDADHQLNTSTGGQRVWVPAPATPGTTRVITLKDTAGATLPPDGWWFEIVVPTSIIKTSFVQIVRETPGSPGNKVAVIGDGTGTGSPGPQQVSWVRVQKISGLWRFISSSSLLAFYGSDA